MKKEKEKKAKVILKICLESTYFTEIEKILLKILYIRIKVNWNSIIRLMNSIKKYSGAMNSNKNKLNSKISSQLFSMPMRLG